MEKVQNIKVSIIVPVYNVEQYIEQCLNSLVNQTLDSYEIIVVNDGSPDNSEIIVKDFIKKYPNLIKYFVKENGGLSDARNYGIEKAKGEYIGFVDSDDYVRNDMFELLYNKAKLEDADVSVCNYATFTNYSVKKVVAVKNTEDFNNNIETVPSLLFQCKSYAWNKLYRRNWYVKNKFKFPINQWFEDSAVVYNMLYSANKIAAVEDHLYFYRKSNEGSITNSLDPRMYDIFKSCTNIVNFYREHTENKDVLDVMERICQIHIFVRLKFLIKKGKKRDLLKFYNKTIEFFNNYIPTWTENSYYKAVKKRSLYLKIRHNKLLMYIYIITPKKLKSILRKLLKKKKSKKRKTNYINNSRLRELQLIELNILKEIDRICKKHNIKYYLGEGTLLGAIRHQGFIPWDDDLDIVMPRKDYEQFIKIVNKEINPQYCLLNEKTSDSYYLPFSKIVSLNNYGYINVLDKFDEEHSGPFVDIFPLDYFNTDNLNAVNKKYKKIRKIRDMLLLKASYIKPKKLKRKIYNIESKFYSNRNLHNKLSKQLKKCNENSQFVCNFASSYHPSKQLVKKEIYGEPKYVKFEDGEFPVPNDYDTLLTTIYGDYMKLPPINKRKCKHGFYDEESVSTMGLTKLVEEEEMEKLALAEVRKLQMYELEILKEVDRVCKENDITYYLGEGTLLGAIRHQGFIPWDDDVDIVMPRDSFDRFLSICDEKLNKNYKLQYYHNIKNYWVQSPKVRMLNKTEFLQSSLLKYTDDIGPYIDIFPLDYTDASLTKLERQGKKVKLYRRILFLKTGFSKRKKFSYKFLKLYSKFLSVKKIHEKINKEATKYNQGKKSYITNFGSYYSTRKETFPSFVYGEPKYVKFEDAEFPVPNNYDYVLTTIYGDYMKLPPKSKQKARHSFK